MPKSIKIWQSGLKFCQVLNQKSKNCQRYFQNGEILPHLVTLGLTNQNNNACTKFLWRIQSCQKFLNIIFAARFLMGGILIVSFYGDWTSLLWRSKILMRLPNLILPHKYILTKDDSDELRLTHAAVVEGCSAGQKL